MSNYKSAKRIIMVRCPECYGTGKDMGEVCATCQGKGEVEHVVWEFVRDDEEVKEIVR